MSFFYFLSIHVFSRLLSRLRFAFLFTFHNVFTYRCLPPHTYTYSPSHPLIHLLDFSLNLITVRFLFLFYSICFIAYVCFYLPISPCLSYFSLSLYFLILSKSLCLSCFYVCLSVCLCVSLCFGVFLYFSSYLSLCVYHSFLSLFLSLLYLLFCYFLSIFLCQSLFSVSVFLSLLLNSVYLFTFSLYFLPVYLSICILVFSRGLSLLCILHIFLFIFLLVYLMVLILDLYS